MNIPSIIAAATLAAAFAQAAQPVEVGAPDIIAHRVNPHAVAAQPTAGGTTATSPITHHGGPVMASPTAYVIWYGNWNQGNGTDTPQGQAIVTEFLQNIGGSPYYDINKTYSIPGTTISGNVTYGGATTDTGSQGKRLSDSKVWAIVQRAINNNALPKDPNGIYFVLTSSDVSVTSGFCTRYCGWHTHGTLTGTDVKYSFVGNAARCLSGCAAQSTSPNNNPGVDGMVSVLYHELVEAASDPDLNAWYDSGGAENADKCAWTFGSSQYQVANGSWANAHLGSRDYLIQRNLHHSGAGDYCAVSVDSSGTLTK